MADSGTPALCAFCRRLAVDPAWKPFCSERCKIQDLARWATGEYRVPGEKTGEPGSETAEDGRQKLEG